MTLPIERAVSQDTPIAAESTVSASDGLLETIRILQENPTIVQSLNERENGEFVEEKQQLFSDVADSIINENTEALSELAK